MPLDSWQLSNFAKFDLKSQNSFDWTKPESWKEIHSEKSLKF